MLIATSGNELHNVNLLSFGVTKELSCCNGPLNSVAYPVSSHKVQYYYVYKLFLFVRFMFDF